MLTDDVERYLALRQALGFRLQGTSRNLRAFALFATQRGDTRIRSASALDWASQPLSASGRYVRLRDVVLFAHFLRAEDPSHELPPARHFRIQTARKPPYIYTPTEIGQLLAAADRLCQSYPLRRAVYRTMLGLIASTGLRPSEALDLRLDDALPGGILRIRKTKFGKSRLVPLHPSTAGALEEYLRLRQAEPIADDHLFLSGSGGRIPSSTVISTFRRLLTLAAIAPEAVRRPRLHDLRHTFATRCLQQCSARRESVARHFVALSTYLGHVDIANTYWYLEATPELLAHIAAAGESLLARSSP
jgi:integrase/recombinase XerD